MSSVIACDHVFLLMAISARVSSTLHLSRSCAFDQLRTWLSVAELSYVLPFERALKYLHIFCPAYSARSAMPRMRLYP